MKLTTEMRDAVSDVIRCHFINILRSAFTLVDPESIKNAEHLDMLLGSAGIKAARRTLMKLSPEG
jgi:hypothetical protein